MSELYADIGWKSILHHGEQLCGDHVEVVESGDNSQVVVLADGLGSGVKASILSTLTSRIISTMMAQGMALEECVAAIAAALPVDAQKGVAYSTFTILMIHDGTQAELIQFDNPSVILLRNNSSYEYAKQTLTIDGKTILKSVIKLREGDLFILMSDGVTNASTVQRYSYTWNRAEIAEYMKIFAPVGYSAKTLATMLADECFRRYGEKPLDDATACIVSLRPKKRINLMFGPPQKPEDDETMLADFLHADGKHIVCGGTTAKLVSRALDKPIKPLTAAAKSDIPPMSYIEGVDLVTEGLLTMNRVSEYASDSVADNARYTEWSNGRDGACRIARLLLEEGTDIHFYVGLAVNEAYQDAYNDIGFHVKVHVVEQLSASLREIGKRVTLHRY